LARDDAASPNVAGRKVSLERALDEAAALLRRSRLPFVYGLSLDTNETALRAAAVAAAISGAIDVEGACAVQDDLVALQTYGLPPATFGEIRARADLVLLWRCDPRPTHPLLLSRPAPLIVTVPAVGTGASTRASRTAGAGSPGTTRPEGGDILLP